jgi:probable F420-dependent oxidoreductase
MKVGIMFANVGPFGEPEGLVNLARSAESVGFESLWAVEHVVVPKGYASRYPYSESGKMPGPEQSPIPDPFVWLAYAAAVTERIRLATGVLILPQRHPLYVAKEVATLDRLSRGRVILGVGIGWLEEEFRALGIPFAERAARTEEAIAALRGLWSDGPSEHAGRHHRWAPLESNPKPLQRPGVPIHVGGHAPGAARAPARAPRGVRAYRPRPARDRDHRGRSAHARRGQAPARPRCRALHRVPAGLRPRRAAPGPRTPRRRDPRPPLAPGT